uniref:Uncharacterized protein n=1 Tax=Emiliania huxleyi (strain CCMP1516) TaxID=280463 RepID=A0A0D3KMM0_EMIH1
MRCLLASATRARKVGTRCRRPSGQRRRRQPSRCSSASWQGRAARSARPPTRLPTRGARPPPPSLAAGRRRAGRCWPARRPGSYGSRARWQRRTGGRAGRAARRRTSLSRTSTRR